jgi:hypothetical protein
VPESAVTQAPGIDVPRVPEPSVRPEPAAPGADHGAPDSWYAGTSLDPSVLRSEPPPDVLPTASLRILLLIAQLVGIAVVVLVEYGEGPDDVANSSMILSPYLVVAVLLVLWSACTLTNSARLVPASPYHRAASAPLAVVLWLLAFVAPLAALRTVDWARDRFRSSADDTTVVIVTVAAVLVAALLVWLPFRYHTVEAHRIGVPGRVVAAWFWLPTGAGVGTLLIGWLGLSEMLREEGLTDAERAVQVGVIFGLPALVFAFATWRVTSVFGEVVDLRRRRWSKEWDDAVAAATGRPMPLPGGPTT